jgi:iron complex transport system permease protein
MNTGQTGETYFKRFSQWKIIVVLLLVVLAITVAVSTAIGPIQISPLDVYRIIFHKIPFIGDLVADTSSPISQEVVLVVRLPRVLAAALVGVALASSGAVLQGLLRNPMADPFIIGVSAGASFGATIAMVFGVGFSLFGMLYAIPIMAFIGALGTVFLVYNLSKRGDMISMLTLLLIGVAITSFFSAIVSLVRLLNSETSPMIVFWLLGSLNMTTWTYVYMVLPFIIIGLALIFYFARDLNTVSLGEEQARHLGVDTENLKKILLICVSLVTAAAVSISGIIGFIGLIIPHIMRLLVGPDHRILLPTSALAGAIVLILCDTLARTILSPSEVPVGILTALLGCPFFIYLLRGKRSSWHN